MTLRCSKLCHRGFSHKSLFSQVPKTYREVYREIDREVYREVKVRVEVLANR